jgi:hypothetical protein
MATHCNQCGTSHPENTKFCSNCGSRLPESGNLTPRNLGIGGIALGAISLLLAIYVISKMKQLDDKQLIRDFKDLKNQLYILVAAFGAISIAGAGLATFAGKKGCCKILSKTGQVIGTIGIVFYVLMLMVLIGA